MQHKFEQAAWVEKQAALKELKEPVGSLNSVAALRERLEKVERVLGLRE